ncbi:glycosyltransferase [Acinetobacter soli]|uniref:glycosyltransferase n=1 Tax=Acinetobacter soli TaxID=487316 RepID=UPI00370A6C76
MKKILVLSKQDSQFSKMLDQVISIFDEVNYRSEHDFPKVSQLIEYIKANNFTDVLMPNPYGNNKRRVSYDKLREENIKVTTSDRGAFPNSWFFDQGFNFDSKSYSPDNWDKNLSNDEIKAAKKYIDELITGENALEKQGKRISGEKLKEKLGLSDKNLKLIFVPLQRPEDTVIKFFSGFAKSVTNFISIIEEVEAKINIDSEFRYVFLLKKHPLETDYFIFNDNKNIGYVPDDTNFYDLMELSDSILLINSGVGLNALTFMKPVVALGNAFYAHNGLAISSNTIEDTIELLKNPIYPTQEKVEKFIFHLINNIYSFGDFETELVKQNDGSFRNITRNISFKEIRWNGEKILLNKKKVLIVSPLVPFPVYRGNQARIDTFIRWLIKNNFDVDLAVLNTSFESEKSNKLRNDLINTYVGIKNVYVLKDPELEKKYQFKKFKNKFKKDMSEISIKKIFNNNANNLHNKIKEYDINKEFLGSIVTHELLNIKDIILGNYNNLVNEKKIPLKFIKSVKQKVQSIDYDYIVLNYAKTIPCIQDVNLNSAKVILDTHDYQSMFLEEDQLFNRKNLNIDLNRYRANEHELMKFSDLIIAINKNEENVFKKIFPEKNIQTIPAFFERPNKGPRFFGYNSHALYVGSISNFNVSGIDWFLKEILPRIIKEIPDFKLTIAGNVGNSKDIDWSKYKDNVQVVGRVDDLSYHYMNSCIVIAPILGGAGMKIKVVEAISYEKVVIGTSKAFDGITYPELMSKCVVNKPEEFADIVINALKDSTLRSELESASKELYDNYHSLDALDKSLNSIFE